MDGRLPELSADARRSPEIVAAFVNATVVLLVPVALTVAAWVGLWFDQSNRVTAASDTRIVFVNLVQFAVLVALFSPLAVVAAWRTWAHAVRYLAGTTRGWQGVVEAGIAGFVIAMYVLGYGIITRPREAPPYVIAYGGAAFVVGIVLGMVLRATAIATLRRQRPLAQT